MSKQLEILVAKVIIEEMGRSNVRARLKMRDKKPKMVPCFVSEPAAFWLLLSVFRYDG